MGILHSQYNEMIVDAQRVRFKEGNLLQSIWCDCCGICYTAGQCAHTNLFLPVCWFSVFVRLPPSGRSLGIFSFA